MMNILNNVIGYGIGFAFLVACSAGAVWSVIALMDWIRRGR